MRIKKIICILIIFLLGSCSLKKKYVTVQLKLDCTATAFFDTLKQVLITDNAGDFDGTNSSTLNFLSPPRVFILNLKKNPDDCFYIDSVPKRDYLYFIIQGKIADQTYIGTKHQNKFSEAKTDTTEVTICIHPIIQRISN